VASGRNSEGEGDLQDKNPNSENRASSQTCCVHNSALFSSNDAGWLSRHKTDEKSPGRAVSVELDCGLK